MQQDLTFSDQKQKTYTHTHTHTLNSCHKPYFYAFIYAKVGCQDLETNLTTLFCRKDI